MGGTASLEESLEAQHKKLLTKNGVLIPPSLLDQLPLSSAMSLLLQESQSPSFAWYLPSRIPFGQRHLRDYLEPGLWLAGSSANGNSTVMAAFNFLQHDDRENYATGDGLLCVSHSLFADTKLHLLAPTRGAPSVTLIHSVLPNTHLGAHLNAYGKGWVGGLSELTLRKPNKNLVVAGDKVHRQNHVLGIRKIILGSSASFQLPPTSTLSSSFVENSSKNKVEKSSAAGDSFRPTITTLYGLAGIDILGVLLGVSADVVAVKEKDFLNKNNILLKTIVQTNLNSDDNDEQAPPPPPLWLMAQAHPLTGDFSVAVSQTLTFDRYVWNILEVRAPWIRNNVSWSVEILSQASFENNRMVSSNSNNSSSFRTIPTTTTLWHDDSLSVMSDHASTTNDGTITSSSPPPPPSTRLTAGAAWQFNRNVAVKAVTTPAEGNIRCGLIFQRWKQPQLTCSVIGEYNLWNQKGRFVGVGLELGSSATPPPSTTTTKNDWDGGSDIDYSPAETKVIMDGMVLAPFRKYK